MKKTVLEWVSYQKLTEKKVEKLRRKIFEKPYSVAYANSTDVTFDADKVKADWLSFQKLSKNLALVKDALINHNANTRITVGGTEMTIVYALNKYIKNDNPLLSNLDTAVKRLVRDTKDYTDRSRLEKQDINNRLLTKANVTEKDKAIAETTCSGYDVVVKDPLGLVELYDKLKEENENFFEEVNTQINLSNAKCELDIALDD